MTTIRVGWVLVAIVVAALGFAGAASAAQEKDRDGRFVAYDDGTVLDTQTRLMWAARDNGKDVDWTGAQSYCEAYREGGHTDWRMPSQGELAGLYDASVRDAAGLHPATALITLTACCLWASDTCMPMLDLPQTAGYSAIRISFGTGERVCWGQSLDRDSRVLPVRFAK